MTNPAKDDEALVERVARALYRQDNGTEAGYDFVARRKAVFRNSACVAIAAVRAHYEERGMVTVPRFPSESQQLAGIEAIENAGAAGIRVIDLYRDMIAAAKPDGGS